MCDCFLKQLYLSWVTNIIVTQLFRVSPEIFLELPLHTITIEFFPVAPFNGHTRSGVPRATKNRYILIREKMDATFHPRVLRNCFRLRSILSRNYKKAYLELIYFIALKTKGKILI